MTPLQAIQKDRGCVVGAGCEGHECTCRRTVRLVLEGVRETPLATLQRGLENLPFSPGSPGHVRQAFTTMIDTALKEVG